MSDARTPLDPSQNLPPESGNRVFVSCVTDEFEKSKSGPTPFPGLRGNLRHYLTKADCEVKVQEDFRQEGQVDLVEKLDWYIRRCDAVIHLIGDLPGAVANPKAVATYLKAEPTFLQNHPELHAELQKNNFADVTYTQWEAFIALYHGKPLFVYATEGAATSQKTHLDRLRLGRKYPGEKKITDPADLFGQLIGDIRSIIASVPKFERKIASSKILRHSPKNLFGREVWLDALDDIWNIRTGINVYSLIAWGGSGKTSVVAHWVANRMAAKKWPGVERYFDWSFYSQGAREQSQASADFFIDAALRFFGDPDPKLGSPRERGERLAGLVRRHRTLLVLDGIEPLQYPPNSPQAGEFKDAALAALVQGLAMENPGLCIITSREPLKLLESFCADGGTAEERRLDHLHREAALALLRHLQIVGTDEELTEAWKTVGGHALTLQLLGRFIAQAFEDRDIRHRDQVPLTEVDRSIAGRTAMKVLLAYEKWLASAGPDRERDLAVLRLTGLFDRPASPDCLAALRKEPAIPGLTDAIVPLNNQQWKLALHDLEQMELITLTAPDSSPSNFKLPSSNFSLDAHPLVREYFALQLKQDHPEAFRAAHSRLFDHLCETTPHQPDGLNGLQTLYQAVTHGCLAGRQQEACVMVYVDRILRGMESDGFYSTNKLGAIGADLGAVAAFFDEPWSRLSPNLSPPAQAWLLNEAATRLRALGRLTEAVEPMRAGIEGAVKLKEWDNAARYSSNLSQLELSLALLSESGSSGRRAIEFADKSQDAFLRMAFRATAADALFQSGDRAAAAALFAEAERMQEKLQSEFPLLNSLGGFQYCDLLLAPAERAAWQSVDFRSAKVALSDGTFAERKATIDEAERRATQTLAWAIQVKASLLTIALDHLTLARAKLYRWLLSSESDENSQSEFSNLKSQITTALARLREANSLNHLPRALLTAAFHAGAVEQDFDAAQRFLAEAQLIAERGPMPLYLADIHLHRARLIASLQAEVRRVKFPSIDPKEELAKARTLIEHHGYGRRKEELEDAEAAFRELDGKET